MTTVDFEDIFDIIVDDDKYEQENILEEYNEDFDFDFIHTNVDEDERPIITNRPLDKKQMEQISIHKELPSNEATDICNKRSLSCSSSSSTSTQSTPSSSQYVIKKSRAHDECEILPAYIQITNTLLDQMTVQINTKDLQELLLLKHKMTIVRLEQELWIAYETFGTGQWKTIVSQRMTTTIDRRVWFEDVKKFQSTAGSIVDEHAQKLYETTVREHLVELNQKIEQYQHEFEERKSQRLFDSSTDIERKIDIFIEQYGLPTLRNELNYKIILFEYDYDIELLQREYIHQNPTADQIHLAQYFFNIKTKYMESKFELDEIKQHILRQQQLPSTSTKVPDPNADIVEVNRTTTTTDSLVDSILRAEQCINKYHQLFNEEIHSNHALTGKLIYIVHQCLKMIEKKLQHMFNYKMKITFNKQFIRPCLPQFIIDTALISHGLTHEQVQLLNRGPTYIPPFQMYIQSVDSTATTTTSTTDAYLYKQYKYLQQDLAKLYTKFNINPARSMFISKDIKELYMSIFAVPIPDKFYERAIYENQLVNSIRAHCQANKFILKRLANQTNVFYLGNTIDYEQKVNEYLTEMNVFEMCETIDETQLEPTHEYLKKIIRIINDQIENILKKKKNAKDLIKQLHVDKNKVRLPYLYFLPDISKRNGLVLKPIVVARKSSISRLGHFLDQLLRPVIQRHTQSTTFADASDFIYKLNGFTLDNKRFHSSTAFVTVTINNLEIMLPHGELLIVLQDYLNEHLAIPFLDNLSVNEIIHLTALFLHHNRVYYNDKIYRCLKGSPSSLPFTQTLLNISAFHWEKNLLREPAINREFYGRCKNKIFFTWNDTQDQFEKFIRKLAYKYPDLPLDVTISSQCHFFDIFLENRHGILYTNVYHDIDQFQYALPYVITNSRHAHSHWFRSALIRAVRYCTNVHDFNRERIHLEVTCLINGYTLEFIEQRLQHFYTHFDVESLRSTLDQTVYKQLRHRLFNFMSEQHEFAKTKKLQEKTNRRIDLNYPYEFGPRNKFEQELRAILIQNFETTPSSEVTTSLSHGSNSKKLNVRFHTKQQYSLNALLTEQKPNHPLINQSNIIL